MSKTSIKTFRGVIIGPPGSGKGTISGRIIKHFPIKHISSGNILRAHVANKTDVGKLAASYMTAGKLVPDDVVDKLITVELQSLEGCNWLLDGYPRTRTQCSYLQNIATLNSCINLDVPFDVIKERLQSRWIHAPSGRVYNLGFNDPKTPGLDDITGEKLVQRDDDKPEAVQKRLEVYSETMGPVIEYYRSLGILGDFYGKTSDEIWPHVFKYLETFFS